MEQTKHCSFCSGELKLNFGLLWKETICPHCSAIIKYRRNIFGHQLFEVRYAGDTEYERILLKQPRRKRDGWNW